MKITAVRPLIVGARMRNWIFVKVETDAGVVGWGECTTEWKTRAVAGCVEDLAPFVVGEDPLRVEHLWQVMTRQPFFRGGIVAMSAISGIDQALWDIAGKVRNVPVYQLLGGAVRTRVRLYDHLGGGDPDAVYESFTPQRVADHARASVAKGFTAVKAVFVPRTGYLAGPGPVRLVDRLMAALRDAVGDGVDLMLDFHGRTTPAMGIQYGRAVAAYSPLFIEEPCLPENVEAMAEVARQQPCPVATGERLVTRFQFRPLLEQRACAVAQADVGHCGGLSELKKIAAMAEAYYVSVAPHNPAGPIAGAAALHFALSTPNFLIQEQMHADAPWRDDVVDEPLPREAGYALPPTRPGLGVNVNEHEAAKHPMAQEPLMRYFYDDGAVADW
ncbi:MAG TPA: galactonate dehydratase [bacterium]|nr:galactonate dehydratase [bacterium]